MAQNKLLVLVCIFAILVEVYNKPTYKSGIRDCFRQECPENTFACEKLTRVSEDKKYIIAEVHCLDLKGKILKNVTNHEDNPYGPNTDFKGYVYQGAFKISIDNEDDSTKENHGIIKNTESEIEDLNGR